MCTYFHITFVWGFCLAVVIQFVQALCEELCVTCLEGRGRRKHLSSHLAAQHPFLPSLHISVSQVFQLGGIPGLVTLLRSPNPGVSQAAAGALRNLVFKDQENKLEVQHCGGIAKALQLLKETDSTDTQKQITGRTKCIPYPLISHRLSKNMCFTTYCIFPLCSYCSY